MEQLVELPRRSEGVAFFLHFTGGFRAANTEDGAWRIEPILAGGKPCTTGPLTTPQLQALARNAGFRAVAFQRIGWTNGEYFSTWAPMLPGSAGAPADLWRDLAETLARPRIAEALGRVDAPASRVRAGAAEAPGPEAALAQLIALGLRNLDLAVERIAAFYHDQLVTHMAAGRTGGEPFAAPASEALPAHVHTFVLHVGAVRDHLGALVARRIGLEPARGDGLARLVGELRAERLPQDPLLDVLFAEGCIAADIARPGRFVPAGWMEEIAALRDMLLRDRPYGSRPEDRLGRVVQKQRDAGLYLYLRPLALTGAEGGDVFDLIHRHYEGCNDLFHKAAQAMAREAAPGGGDHGGGASGSDGA